MKRNIHIRFNGGQSDLDSRSMNKGSEISEAAGLEAGRARCSREKVLGKRVDVGDAARKIRAAYDAQLTEGKPAELTRDLGGVAGTKAFTKALIRRIA